HEPDAVQTRHWGLTASQIARRLARRWELPPWLAAVVGHLDLPVDLSAASGADPALMTITQAALSLTARHGRALQFALWTPLEEALGWLGIEPEAEDTTTPTDCADAADGNPYDAPWLRGLLELAVENAGR